MSRILLLLCPLLAACDAPQGFAGVDHRVFYDTWVSRGTETVPEGERTAALQVRGSQADGRDATFTRLDRTEHGPDSLTPGCLGELWRRGRLVATQAELREADPGDPRFPQGRTAEVAAMAFTVEEAVVRRADCDDADDELPLEQAPGVPTAPDEEADPVPYSRPTDDTWWIGGPRDVLLERDEDDEAPSLVWPG